ncbi:DUF4179 domain-containing protein [Brevibacillus brevis]|uniref:DUF4179 domain-containing protein n=1 Tax=Brevibacillus brevis TaxID=1393 RepID=A0ABY9T0F8_BREBE|nr:DUF4179 domain-containing protein [Brevibacillus brevis]WNC13569.1 DUF4179 domain-containing protein [Brevibacillus brevis]
MNESQMDKELRQFAKNAIVDVPARFSAGIDHVLDSLPPQPMRKNRSTRKNYWLMPVACLFLGVFLLIGTGFVSPTMAHMLRNLPFVGSIIGFIGDSGIREANQQGLATRLEQMATDQGITVALKEAYYDRLNLSVGFTVTFPPNETRYPHIEKVSYSLGGQTITRTFTEEQAKNSYLLHWRHAEGNTYYGTFQPFFTEPLPEELPLKLKLEKMGGVEGEWQFDIPLSRKPADEFTKVTEPKVSGQSGDYTISVKQVIRAPSATRIVFGVQAEKDSLSLTEDDKVNQIMMLSNDIRVFDSKGVPLSSITDEKGNRGGGIIGVTQFSKDFHPISPESRSITIVVDRQLRFEIPLD